MSKKLCLLSVLITLFGCIAADVAERRNFFNEIIGQPESEFVKEFAINNNDANKLLLECQEKDGRTTYFLKNKKTGEKYQAGFFKEYSIKELRAHNDEQEKIGGGTFHVVEARNTKNAPYRDCVDIGALQANPQNKHAAFQVASNFSALEPTSVHDYPEGGISKYIYDYTQGPFASISAAPGLIYRMYYLFCERYKNSALWRQTKDTQVNLLDDTNIPTRNGYIVLDRTYLSKPQEKDLLEKIKIGYHRDIQVTYGFLQDLKIHKRVKDTTQIVDQVFTAALDFGNTNQHWKSHKNAQKLAQTVLDAAYEGTVRAALMHGKKKLVLTLIGGGVFENTLTSIANALEKSLPIIKDYGLDVTLIIYDAESPAIKPQMADFRKKMKQFSLQTHGTYTVYGK